MEIPYEVTPRRDTGLFNAKLGIWLFLASEVMLFGGLFSAYVFLRVGVDPGVDNPWPLGLNVQNVLAGFVNTLVLILSSVLVVFAWVALKERKWKQYQLLMYSVVACAVVFMCIKGYEYNAKLNHHFGVKLTDNSVMEGELVGDSDRIHFEGSKISLRKSGGLPAVLDDISDEDFPVLKVEGTETVLKSKSEVRHWFLKSRRETQRAIEDARRDYRADKRKSKDGKSMPVSDRLQKNKVNLAAVLVADKPFKISGHPRKVVMHNATSLSYRDGVTVEGKLISDAVKMHVHSVDLQLVLPVKQDKSMVWKLIGEDGKKQFIAEQKEDYEHMRSYYEARGKIIPMNMLRGYVINLQDVHLGAHHAEGEKGEGHAADGGHGDHAAEPTVVTIPRDQIKFMGSHGPRYGTYYAIYFTMTALHGLHVIGGALVLLFFTVFGKKLYLKNPEHLANRVEVGGLFWHFVDLIWIFLFPIMYLL